MADISELILQVKNADSAVKEIDKVDKKLKQTAENSEKIAKLGKTLFAGWTLSKSIGLIKSMGDAFKDAELSTRKFNVIFGAWNKNARIGVKNLVENFHETERSAKNLMATIGSRLDFGFDDKVLGKVSSDLARISQELASFYGKSVNEVSLKLTQALAGQTKGLKEYGINIDINSEKFKKLAEEIKISTGETKEGSKALAVYSNILGKTKAVEGTFATSAKSISQILEDLKKSFIDGPLTQAGRILSEVFGPILKGINDILNNKVVAGITAISLSLFSLIAVIKSVWVILSQFIAFTGLPRFVGIIGEVSVALSRYIPKLIMYTLKFPSIFNQLLNSIASFLVKLNGLNLVGKIGKFFNGIFLVLFKALGVDLMAKATAAIIGVYAVIGAAIIAGLAYLLNTCKDFISSWGSKLWNFGKSYFEGLIEKFNNFMKMGKFDTTEAIVGQAASELLIAWQKKVDAVKEMNEKIDETAKELNDLIRRKVQAPTIEKFYQFRGALKSKLETVVEQRELEEAARKEYEDAQALFDKVKKNVADTTAWAIEIEGNKDKVSLAEKKFMEAMEKYKEAQKKRMDAEQDALNNAKEIQDLQQLISKAADTKFSDFSWYADLLKNIQGAISKVTPQQKLKEVQSRIDKFKETYKNVFLNPEELKAKYKELAGLQMQKFEAEMEALNQEREYLASTNEMIKGYVDKAMEWKAQGVDAIDAGTAEGYKFMTSGFSSLANIGPLLKDQESESSALQEKANAIAEGSKNILEGIKKKIDKIDTNGSPLAGGILKIVN